LKLRCCCVLLLFGLLQPTDLKSSSIMSSGAQRKKKVNLGKEGETPREIINRKSLKKKVDLGEEGATPKKFYPANSFELRRVNVGLDGLTPKKVVQSDGTTKAYNFSKSVNVGVEGHTPIKTFEFYSNIPVAAAPNHASFAKTIPVITNPLNRSPPKAIPVVIKTSPKFVRVHPEVEAENFSPGGTHRPKTSRGKSHPSPDEFFDYVVPSPPATKYADRIIFDPSAESVGTNANDISTELGEADTQDGTDISGNYDMLDLNSQGPDGEDSEAATEEATFEEDVDGESEVYETNGSDNDEADIPTPKLAKQLSHNNSVDELRNKQIRMLGCWLFGSALRI